MVSTSDLTTFVGRGRELADLEQLLRSCRLVTLTGPAGSGKTRLALKAAQRLAGAFPDGVWVAELGPETNARNLALRVANSFGLQENASTPAAELLVNRLSAARGLLVLDSCEHVVEECAELATYLLPRCPGLALMATSQEPLGVASEIVWRVPPLSLPDQDGVTGLFDSESVELFVERARSISPEFALTPANAYAIAHICLQLDGIPLAIELAAARTRLLAPHEILTRLENRFALLVGGNGTALARHQTLRAAVSWSYDLLGELEKSLFCRLSIFPGGFTVDAAEAICGYAPLERTGVLEILERLGDRSMLVEARGSGGRRRHRMLESLRQFGAERLNDMATEADVVRHRHCGFYLDLVIEIGRQSQGSDQVAAADILDEEADNIRAALAWGVTHHPLPTMEAVAALRNYWIDRGSLPEGRRWASEVLKQSAEPSDPRGAAVYAAAAMAWNQSDIEDARDHAQQALDLAHSLGSQALEGNALTLLGILDNYAGNAAEARRKHERAHALWKAVGNDAGIATVLNNMALIAYDASDLDEASRYCAAALAAINSARYVSLNSQIYETQYRIEFAQHNLVGAASSITAALRCAVAAKSKPATATALEDVATLAITSGELPEGVVFGAAAAALREEIGCRQPREWRERYGDSLERAMNKLGAVASSKAWERGSTMATGSVVALALQYLENRHKQHALAPKLTKRQSEIARLVMSGLTNRQIALRLSISERTADAHVDNIMRRLDVHSRAQVAAWAVQTGLAAIRI